MGAIRWTGQAFKIVGGIMTADAFEEWAKTAGEDFITERAQEISISWFRGNARAEKSVLREIEARVASEAGKSALYSELNNISIALWWVDRWASKIDLLRQGFLPSVHVLPRFAVREVFAGNVIANLSDADELLRSYIGLPELFLGSCARRAEDAFVEWADKASANDKHRKMSRELAVIGVDRRYDWKQEIPGHYYVVPSVSERQSIRDVQKGATDQLATLVKRLGSASREEKESTAASVWQSLNGQCEYAARGSR